MPVRTVLVRGTPPAHIIRMNAPSHIDFLTRTHLLFGRAERFIQVLALFHRAQVLT